MFRDWTPQDWAIFLPLLATTLGGLYLTVVKPLLTQLKELVLALRQNTTATNTSADNLATTAAAVTENTVVTKAVADALPNGPVTVNVSQPPAAP